MANTYTLISSNTLTSSAASVTFSSIPSTYTDLVLKCSTRNNTTGRTNDQLTLSFTANTGTLHSRTQLSGDGATTASDRTTSTSKIDIDEGTDGPNATANSFASNEFYIPSYLVSQNKPLSNFSSTETNGTTAFLTVSAGLYRSTSAITEITIDTNGSFVSGSSFYLYGIKNS